MFLRHCRRKRNGKQHTYWALVQSYRTAHDSRKRAGLGDAPGTLLEEFAKVKSGDVVLPISTRDGQTNKMVRLRCVTTPDGALKVLLNRLGFTLP